MPYSLLQSGEVPLGEGFLYQEYAVCDNNHAPTLRYKAHTKVNATDIIPVVSFKAITGCLFGTSFSLIGNNRSACHATIHYSDILGVKKLELDFC